MRSSTLVASLVILIVVGAGVLYFTANSAAPGPVACTAEAKLCPDGSAVGRTGPNCEFAPCPQAATTSPGTENPPVAGAGEHCGGFIRNAPVCATGYHCQLKISNPDIGGTCVADQTGGGGILPHTSGVRGSVMLGPTCPVMRDPPDPQCADKPYQTTILVYHTGSGTVIATGKSAADGTFEISLPAGSYTLAAQGGSMLPRCSPVQAVVTADGYVTANISCDTGIR